VSVERDVAYNEGGRLDVYRPASTVDGSNGGPWPVVVIFGGRSSDKSHYSTVAAAVAAGGAVVMVPNYRVTENQPVPLIDARCVVRLAATRADAYGGEPGTVTLAGYAWGATAAVGEAFDGPWRQMATPPSSCAAPADAAVTVRAVVGLVGDYDYYAAADPRAAVYGAYAQVTASPQVPVRLVQGVPDQLAVTPEETSAFAAALEAAGHPVTVADVALPNLALAGLHIDGRAGLSLLDVADHGGVDAAAAEILAAARS
jgi:acetyl esterase/lipase